MENATETKPRQQMAAEQSEEDQEPRLRFMWKGDQYEIELDPAKLDIGEIADLEMHFDRPLMSINLFMVAVQLYLAYIAVRRKHPDVTLEELRSMKFGDFYPTQDDDDRPTEAGAEEAPEDAERPEAASTTSKASGTDGIPSSSQNSDSDRGSSSD